MQWRSSDGLTEVYQDAIKLEMKTDEINRHMGYSIPSNGTMVLGQELDGFASGFENHQAFKGSLAGLNFWTFFLSVDEIQGMAAGIMNVNGNLLQWRDFRDHTFGDVSIVDRSEAEIPGILTTQFWILTDTCRLVDGSRAMVRKQAFQICERLTTV